MDLSGVRKTDLAPHKVSAPIATRRVPMRNQQRRTGPRDLRQGSSAPTRKRTNAWGNYISHADTRNSAVVRREEPMSII
eukprot:6595155-Alexandrium_andersonii.AAC.1